VVVAEPRQKADGYYPECVAISHTTSEDVGVDPELAEGWGEPGPSKTLDMPCPVIAVNGVCGAGHHWAKACICNREWCSWSGGCGGQGGSAHQRRKARWLPKAFKMNGMGHYVFPLPPEVRHEYRTQEALGALGKAIKRLLQRHGYRRGLRRWHLFGEDHPGHGLQGDGLPPYHPHLEALTDGGHVRKKELKAIKQSLANILGVSVERIVIYYQYVQPGDARRMLHRVSYSTRPTFTDWSWDEELAYNLKGFHNAQSWGSLKDWSGPNMWTIDPKEDAAAAIALEEGLCPRHPKWETWSITWGGLIPIQLIKEPYWVDAGWGGGYWRWTGYGEPDNVVRARDGPGE